MSEESRGTIAAPKTEIKVLVKAMQILAVLGGAPNDGLELKEIAAVTAINKSTCHHILNTLVAGGFVERDVGGGYRVGIGLFRIGSNVMSRLDVRRLGFPEMERLQTETGETVFLYIPSGDEAVCIERIDGRYSSTHLATVGGALPLHVGAAPKIFLAQRSTAEIAEYLARHATEPTVAGLDADAFAAEIERIARTGTANSDGDVEVNTSAFSAAIRDHTGAVVAAISASWLNVLGNEDRERLQGLVRASADRISARMGFAEPRG